MRPRGAASCLLVDGGQKAFRYPYDLPRVRLGRTASAGHDAAIGHEIAGSIPGLTSHPARR